MSKSQPSQISNNSTTNLKRKKSKSTNNTSSKRKHNDCTDDEDTGSGSDSPEPPPPKKAKKAEIKEARTPKEKDAAFRRRFDKSLSDEGILGKQQAVWKSDVYKHFQAAVILYQQGICKYSFQCKEHPNDPKCAVTRARYDTSTTNLVNHVKSCQAQTAPPEQAITAFMPSRYDQGEFRTWLNIWVSRRQRPFEIVKDPELLQTFKILNPNVTVVCPQTISLDIKEIRELSIPDVAASLQKHRGFIHLSFDGWTAANVQSFLGMDVNYCNDEGNLVNFTLDFTPLRKRHSGANLADAMLNTLKQFGIEEKIFGLIGDNASNNDTMIENLELKLINCPAGESSRVRCMCHVLNLIVTAILRPFKLKSKVVNGEELEIEDDEDEEDDLAESGEEDEDSGDEYAADEGRDSGDQRIIREVMKEVRATTHIIVDDDEWNNGRLTMRRTQRLTKRVHYSKAFRDELKALAEKSHVKYRTLKRTVSSRWNTVGIMLSSIRHLKEILKRFLRNHKDLPSFGESEWTFIEQLEELLRPFVYFTERMSGKKRPLIHEVIPLMDTINAKLEKAYNDHSKMGSIRIAAQMGLKILDKYYAKTDDSLVYRSAMIMNPAYKIKYFDKFDWPEDWISSAKDALRTHWETWYRPEPVVKPSQSQAAQSPSSNDDEEDDMDPFADLHDGPNFLTFEADALDEYLASPLVDFKKNPDLNGSPLKWWCFKLSSKIDGVDPHLARMAIDLLSIPAASTDVERDFSRGGLMVSKRRHGLKDESIRSGMTVGAWHDQGLLPMGKLIKNFNDKRKRIGTQLSLKGKGKEVIEVSDGNASESEDGSSSNDEWNASY